MWVNGVENRMVIDMTRAMVPPSLLGMDRRIPYANRKYHSGLMCCGVTKGLAFEKFSGSLNISGMNDKIMNSVVSIIVSNNISLCEWYGWNGILSMSEFVPSGLVEPFVCRSIICREDNEIMTNGRIKCRAKNRVRVGSLIENPPQNQVVSIFPKYGTAVNRFVITVAAQNDICPHGNT